VADGKLKVTIGARYPLKHAAAAHAAMESRATTGKVILLP
jgi:NADPH2:quinone reductase